jgi:hypothetical protein
MLTSLTLSTSIAAAKAEERTCAFRPGTVNSSIVRQGHTPEDTS